MSNSLKISFNEAALLTSAISKAATPICLDIKLPIIKIDDMPYDGVLLTVDRHHDIETTSVYWHATQNLTFSEFSYRDINLKEIYESINK